MADVAAVTMRRKRGNGEGNIYQRSDGRWEGRVSLPNGDRKSVYGQSRREVADRVRDVLQQLQSGVLPPPDRVTVGDLLYQWLTEGARTSVRPSTYRSYADIVRIHLLPDLARIRLTKLEPHHVERLLARKLDSGLSARRVQYIHAVLRRALNRAVRWGWVSRNVATLVDIPRVERKEIEPLNPAEIAAFLRQVGGDRLEALYVLALTTGLRRGELLGLRWSDLDVEAGTVRVARALQRVNGKTEFVEPKSARSRRVVMFPPFVSDVLRVHRARQAAERLAAGPIWHEADLVFTTAEGNPLDGMNLTHRFQRLLERAGVPRRRFHDLRHSCAVGDHET